MFKQDYKNAYDEIKAADGSVNKILERASGKSTYKKKRKVWKPVIVTMLLAVTLIVSVNIPTFAQEMERMTNILETGAIDYTSYKSFQRNNPKWIKNSFIPENAVVRKDGVIMKVELATFDEREFIAYISFANEESCDLIQKDGAYDWSGLSVKIDGRTPVFQDMKFWKYDEETEKAYYVYTARRHTAKVPEGEMICIQLKGLSENNKWEENLDLTNIEKSVDTRVVKIQNSEVDENLVKLENAEFPYKASVLNLTPLSEIKTDEASVTGIVYVDGVLRVQTCCPDTALSNTSFQRAYVYGSETDHEMVFWYEKVDGKMMEFIEKYYVVSEENLNNLQLKFTHFENKGLLNTIWEVEFEVKNNK